MFILEVMAVYLSFNIIVYFIFRRKLVPAWMETFRKRNKYGTQLPAGYARPIIVFFNVILLPFVLIEMAFDKLTKKGMKDDVH